MEEKNGTKRNEIGIIFARQITLMTFINVHLIVSVLGASLSLLLLLLLSPLPSCCNLCDCLSLLIGKIGHRAVLIAIRSHSKSFKNI